MKPGYTPDPIILPDAFTNLIENVKKTDIRLYDALVKIYNNIYGEYQFIKNHEDRLINLEKSKKQCRMEGSSTTVITTATQTAIPFPTEVYDNDDMHDLSVNNSRITFNTPGYYIVGGSVQWETGASAVGMRLASIDYNGLAVTSLAAVSQPGSLLTIWQTLSTGYLFNQGDWIILRVFQDSGGDLDVGNTRFWAHMTERVWNREDIPNRMVE